jgi:hypothetical protein
MPRRRVSLPETNSILRYLLGDSKDLTEQFTVDHKPRSPSSQPILPKEWGKGRVGGDSKAK